MARYRQLPIHDARDKIMDANARAMDADAHLRQGMFHHLLNDIKWLRDHLTEATRLIDQSCKPTQGATT